MKYLVLLALMLPAFSQKILKVKDDNVLISNDDIELESGKKYYLETDSGESLIGVYTNGSSESGYVARILEGDLSEGDRITSHRKKKISGGSMASGPFKKFRFGLHGGVNLTSMPGSCEETTAGWCDDNFDSSVDSEAGLAFQGGLILQYHLSSKLAINAKISYNLFTSTIKDEVPTGATTTGPFEAQTDYSTISFQPTIKYYFISALFASTGIRLHMPMSLTSQTVDTSNGETFGTEADLLDEQTYTANGLAKPGMYLDIPLNVGASFNLGKLKLEPNFTYYFPLSTVLETDAAVTDGKIDIKLGSMAFNLDVLF